LAVRGNENENGNENELCGEGGMRMIDIEWWQNMRMDCAGRRESKRQNRE
jgi:hypothetical protein